MASLGSQDMERVAADTKQIAIAVVERNGSFLVGQRPSDVPLGGYFEFPGGKVESGESVEEAAVRECLEETGLHVRANQRMLDHCHQYDHGRVQLHFVECRLVDDNAEATPPYRWASRSELGQLQFPDGNRELLRKLLAE